MQNPNSDSSTKALFAGNTGWALVTGLALGFAVGQSVGQWGALERDATVETTSPATTSESMATRAPVTTSPASSTSPPPASASPPGRVYTSVADFPPGWLRDTDIPDGVLDGLKGPQIVTAMQVLNERNCECGCRFGTLASCLKNDPGCPRSPVLSGMIVSMARQDQSVASILQAVDVGQSGMNRAKKARDAGSGHSHKGHRHDTGRRVVELAAWNPRQGPAAAKVTIVEFSDFQ